MALFNSLAYISISLNPISSYKIAYMVGLTKVEKCGIMQKDLSVVLYKLVTNTLTLKEAGDVYRYIEYLESMLTQADGLAAMERIRNTKRSYRVDED